GPPPPHPASGPTPSGFFRPVHADRERDRPAGDVAAAPHGGRPPDRRAAHRRLRRRGDALPCRRPARGGPAVGRPPAACPEGVMEPKRIKNEQRRAWEENAPGWRRHWGVREALGPVTEALFELADLKPGQWVLDVATGIGEPALSVARRVGPTGKVVGIDLSPRMVAYADERARAEGLKNASFHVLDAEELLGWPEASYDAALCRFG